MENRIAIFSPHTTWDGVQDGVGEWLAQCLPLEKCDPIHPGVVPSTGMGRICQLTESLSLREAIEIIKTHIGIPHLRLALARGKSIGKLNGSIGLVLLYYISLPTSGPTFSKKGGRYLTHIVIYEIMRPPPLMPYKKYRLYDNDTNIQTKWPPIDTLAPLSQKRGRI